MLIKECVVLQLFLFIGTLLQEGASSGMYPTDAQCRDLSHHCRNTPAFCHNTKFKIRCKKTCGICDGPSTEKTTSGNPENYPSTNSTPEIVTTSKITTIQNNTVSYPPTEKPTSGNFTGNSAQPTTYKPGITDAPSETTTSGTDLGNSTPEEPSNIGCHGKKCNELCYVYDKVHGVCDLEGSCIPFDSLPFPFDLCDEGCNFKKCGFFCQVGDISGFCDANMNCEQIADCDVTSTRPPTANPTVTIPFTETPTTEKLPTSYPTHNSTSSTNCEKCSCWECLNNGECFEKNGKPNCECPKGFSGNHCQFKDFDCPTSCPEIYDPVCGSDCNNYNNECELKVEACYTHNHDLKVEHEGECCCDKSSFCNKYATEDVCADKTGDVKKKWVQERCQKTCGLCD